MSKTLRHKKVCNNFGHCLSHVLAMITIINICTYVKSICVQSFGVHRSTVVVTEPHNDRSIVFFKIHSNYGHLLVKSCLRSFIGMILSWMNVM